MTKAATESKPFVSYNKGHDFNEKAPKYKQANFVVDGKLYEVAIWEKKGKNGQPYLILKLEDQLAATMAAHERKLAAMGRPEELTDATFSERDRGTHGSKELAPKEEVA